jgi:hypothetical protein
VNGKALSSFNGPVVFTNKVTSNSPEGIEANSLFLQGNASVSRKYTVGISTPILSGNAADVEYYSQPDDGGYLGWVYTNNNSWRKFAPIQNANGHYVGIWSGTFIGNGSGLFNIDSIWKVDTVGIHTTKNVGIATTSAESDYALYVNGNTKINGTLNVYEVIEKATISTGILTATTTNIDLAENNVFYFTNQAQANWVFNFRGNSTTTLNNFLQVGDSITVAILTTQGSTAYYNTSVTIDGASVATKYYGGVPYTSGNANSVDVYTYVIIKTASNAYTVLASQSQYT